MQVPALSATSAYETEKMVNQYLLMHYGNEETQLPYAFGPRDSINFPERCVKESLEGLDLPHYGSALDIGCAVGRASFELARHFDHVVAIDYSQHFIAVAKQLQREGKLVHHVVQEGERSSDQCAIIPPQIDPNKVDFRCLDAMTFFKEKETFDFVLAANLICRLSDPRLFLESVHHLVNTGGVFALASPYSWLEEFTPRSKWLGNENESSFDVIQKILTAHFTLIRTFDAPFLIREHARKYQWGISQASLWRKER